MRAETKIEVKIRWGEEWKWDEIKDKEDEGEGWKRGI